MKRRIIINMCLTVLLAIVATSVLSIYLFFTDFEKQLKNDVMTDIKYVTVGMKQNGTDYLNSLDLMDEIKTRITLVDTDGTVLFDNYKSAEMLGNHLNRPEITEALENGTGESMRLSETLDTQTYYYAVKLDDGMILRMAGDMNSVYSVINNMLPVIISMSVFVFIIAMIIANFQTKRLIEPINNLDIDNPEKSVVYDELSPLISKMGTQQKLIKTQMDELKVQQLEFAAITDNMAEGFIVVDTKSDVLSYNNAALKMLGVQHADEKHRNLIVFNRRMSFNDAVKKALAGQTTEQIIEVGVNFYQIIANPVMDGDNTVGAVIVILDVTETHARENLRREFSANVSHELRTPLTSISGYAEIIKNGIAKDEDVSRFAGKIYDEAQRLVALINDIIRLSQLDEDDSLPDRDDIDIYALCSSIVDRIRINAENRGIKIKLSGKPVKVHGIRQVIDEMIYNLCDNAVKYNKDNGRVSVDVKTIGNEVQVVVSDTGIGIPSADKERVFERFYRVDKSHSKIMGGTGLGLSIVKHGAALHDARINLESKTNSGTTITLTFHTSNN